MIAFAPKPKSDIGRGVLRGSIFVLDEWSMMSPDAMGKVLGELHGLFDVGITLQTPLSPEVIEFWLKKYNDEDPEEDQEE